mgnify:CR=1 FL=1
MRLDELEIGKDAVVAQVSSDDAALHQHILDMGLTPGTEVTMVKYAPMGDPLELRLRGYELTLRRADAARIAAQVVSGISFLGAGVIFKNGNSIRGLTTAAGMWGTAAIGMAVGAGMYWLGLFESAVLVAIQVILHRFPVGADALTTQEILVEMEDTEDMQRRFDELLKKHGGQVTDSSLTREDGFLRMEITAKLEPPISHEEALAFMKENTGVRRMSV